MRKIFILLAGLLMACQLHAQDINLLKDIRSAGASVKSIDSKLVNETVKTNGKNMKQSGKLFFVSNDKFAALFDTEEYMIVNKDRMKINVGIFHGRFRLNEGGMMRGLSNIFLYGFQGRCQELADDNNYTLTTEEDDDAHYVIFNSKKKPTFGLGYQKVVFTYSREDLRIREIKLIDYKGTIDTYTISDTQYNVKVAESKFDL